MPANHELQDRMAALARDLQAEESPEKTLQHVVEAAVDLVPACEAASISLASRRGEIRTSAATGADIARADELQMELREGPCVDAVWKEQVVRVPDLAGEDRWPTWGPRAVEELGFRSMTCLQLFTHADRVGALNLFAGQPRAFDDQDVQEGLAIAAHAAVAVVAAEQIDHLEVAMDNRTTIGQATGLVMAHCGLSRELAFDVLRRLSNEQNRKLSAVAREMVATHDRDRKRPRIRRP